MALKKTDLYRSLWESCDQLRGSMDASQYKDYILTLLFVKYVSDKKKADPDSLIDVPEGGSFDDMIAAKDDKEIGDKINKIIAKLAEANDLQRVIDVADFNDEDKLGRGKEMQSRLTKLVGIFEDLDFRRSRAGGDDLLGDAYEYLMRHFATQSGKSKGQFYTPAEVSRVMAKIVGINAQTRQDDTVYDPTCGSGSLLLKVADEAPRGITIYGQEKDNATWALARMNMILHGQEDHDLRSGDSITNPRFINDLALTTFDFVVANPPFSVKSWNNGLEKEYGRFEFGKPPAKNGDYAFLLHILTSLKSTGKAAVILPHGVLFRGNAEADIRRELLRRGYIKGIIGLPPNLFYGTGIPACIVVLDKENAQSRSGVFMIDASKGFIKDGAKNRLRSQDIHKIVETFTKRIGIDRYSRMVPMSEIADPKNDYNLNIPRYIDSSEPEDLQDLHAHLHGGIPDQDLNDLAGYWEAFPNLRNELFETDRPGYSRLKVEIADVQQYILDSADFQRFANEVEAITDAWFAAQRDRLASIGPGTRPNELIAEISENLLRRFTSVTLLDEYDVYEQLMTYWHDVIHDDIFLIMSEGWLKATKPRMAIQDKDRKLAETPDLEVGTGQNKTKYKMDLIPPNMIVERYFNDQKVELNRLIADFDSATQIVEELIEGHGQDEGLLSDAVDEKGKMTQKAAVATLKKAKAASDEETFKCAQEAITALKQQNVKKKAAKEKEKLLFAMTLEKYHDLTVDKITAIVLDDKWNATIRHRVAQEVKASALDLVKRLRKLGNRYAFTVEALERKLGSTAERIAHHLAGMGLIQLVTGDTRLPGFTEPWQNAVLGDVLKVRHGRNQKAVESSSGNYPILATGGQIGWATTPLYTKPSVLIGRKGTIDKPQFMDSPFWTVDTLFYTEIDASADPKYLYYLFLTIDWKSMNEASGVPSLSATRVENVEVRLPGINEQRAIRSVLDDIDSESTLLRLRLSKAQDIKQGMMQELLTGRTRLSLEEEAP